MGRNSQHYRADERLYLCSQMFDIAGSNVGIVPSIIVELTTKMLNPVHANVKGTSKATRKLRERLATNAFVTLNWGGNLGRFSDIGWIG